MKTIHPGRRLPASVACGATLLLAAACAEHEPPESPTQMPPPPAMEPKSRAQSQKESTSVNVSEEIRRECELPDAPREVPQFDFDGAQLRARGRNILDDVSDCFTEGALAGRTLTIVGRADPRGTVDYNRALGLRRADSAQSYLVRSGMNPDQIQLLSRGEKDATGYDERTWQLDRRVDFELDSATTPASSASR